MCPVTPQTEPRWTEGRIGGRVSNSIPTLAEGSSGAGLGQGRAEQGKESWLPLGDGTSPLFPFARAVEV